MPVKITHGEFLQRLATRNVMFPESTISLVGEEQYQSIDTKLSFVCSNGHVFSTAPRHIFQRQSGCPSCGSQRAGTKNIKQHSTFIVKLNQRNAKAAQKIYLKDGEQYMGTYTKLWFVCEQNHTFQTLPKTVVRGSGCPSCKTLANSSLHKYTTQVFVTLLDERNIQYPHKKVFLKQNEEYKGFRYRLFFECEKQHIWKTTPDNVLNGKSGCPFCAATKSFSYMAIEWLETTAKQENINILHRGNTGIEFSILGTHYKADGFCPATSTVYEFYGNYWHGNPRLFDRTEINEVAGKSFGELYDETKKREQDILLLGYKLVTIWEDEYDKRTAEENEKHAFQQLKNIISKIDLVYIPLSYPYEKNTYVDQLNQAYKNNKRTIFIFEDEWRKNKALITSKLVHLSKQSTQQTIHARHCTIGACSPKQKATFLNTYHSQGNDNSQIAYGAYYKDELVAIMTFSTPRAGIGVYKNKQPNMYELVRFTTNTNYRIPGIASKLLMHFQRNNQWKQIYSYADRRWSDGNLYEKLGFTLERTNPPDYFYIVNGVRKHRWNYRKDILKKTLSNYDPILTEYQNMVNHGYWRVWDCGTLKYVLENKRSVPTRKIFKCCTGSTTLGPETT